MSEEIDLDYSYIFNATSNGMSFTEYESGKIVDVNECWIKTTGIARKSAIGKTAFEMGLWASKADREACVAELDKSGRVVDFETRLIIKETETPYLIRSQSVRIAGKHFALWEFQDITERKRMEAEASAWERELQSTLDAIPDLLFEVGLNGRIYNYHSPRTDLLATPPDVFLGKLFFDVIPPHAADVCLSAISEAHEKGFSIGKQYALQFPHGKFWFELSVSRKPAVQGREPCFILLARDITLRKLGEYNQNRLARALKLISSCNSVLVRAENEQELFAEICRLAVETGDYLMAWVGVANHDADKTVRPVMQFGYIEGYLDNANITWSDTEYGQGSTGTAIRTGKVVINDIQSSPKMSPWREAALKRGYKSSIALPLYGKQGIWGALSIYSKETSVFGKEEVELLEELAKDISFGIETLRTRVAHDTARTALIESETRFRNIMEYAPIGMATTALDGQFLLVNQAFCDMVGYRKEELEKLAYQDITHQDDKTLTLADRKKLLQGEIKSYLKEKRYISKDRQVVWVRVSSSSVSMDSGAQPYFVAQIENITERKQAEELLLKQKNFSDEVINNLPGIFYMINRQGGFVRVNPRFLEVSGYSGDEIGSMPVVNLFEGEGKDIIAQRIGEVFEKGDSRAEAELITKSGQKIPYFFSGHLTIIDDQAYLVGLGTDITARKQAEVAFQQQLLFSDALNKISKTLVEQDSSRAILENTVRIVGEALGVDRALIYGVSFSKQQIIGLSQWLNPDRADIPSSIATYPLDEFVNAITEIGKTRSWFTSHSGNINPLLMKDGSGDKLHHKMGINSLFWYPFGFSEDGYYLGVLNQMHTHKEWTREEIGFLDSVSQLASVALEKIHMMEEREQAASDMRIAATSFEVQEGILITDTDSVILRVNGAFAKITGYTPGEIIGKKPNILSSGRQDSNFYAAMWENINNTGTWEGELWNRRKNGEIYPEHLTITAVKDPHGNVMNYVGAFSDITKSKAAEEAIRELAFFDPLTKLSNRRLLQDRLFQALSSSDRSGQTGALLFIDLDNFKVINDTLGHAMGDILLQEVAERLKSCVRIGDTVARLGGDEFVVMLEDLSEQALEAGAQAEAIGEKVLATLNQPYRLGRKEYLNSPSIGITLFNGHQQLSDDLFKQADIAMYQAKKDGRNVLRFFDPKMQEAINARSALEGELRKAIEHRQFQLHYQVQVDHLQRPYGAEALIRWIHPNRDFVSPAEFIPLAEDTGLILAIGNWVLETACAQLKSWQLDNQTRDLMLSVNVSAKQFRQADFVAQVRSIVKRYAIDPTRLKLELTESVLLDNVAGIIETMNTLNEIGVRFSLDDFGTGYSSLQYLKKLPLHQLKIDQSFVRDLAVDSSDKAIVNTVIAMAHSLNLEVIAEGVETEEQRQYLESAGCTHYQGYFFGKPMPIKQFKEALK